MKKISKEALKRILEAHKLWIDSPIKEGTRANLNGTDLNGATLIGAELSGATLIGADLSGADLIRADLSGADLSRAALGGADLSRANLSGANLSRTSLSGADLSRTNLSGADLSRTNLSGANLSRTNLSGTNLSGAILLETIFADVYLNRAKNIEGCLFAGPCVIDFRTLEKSRNLPPSFLRGCGLPEKVIENLPGLVGDSIEYYTCFISYSEKEPDGEFARKLHSDLQGKGVRCWFAPHDLKIGEDILDTINEKIRVYDKLMLILSDNSTNSNWVKHEVKQARSKELNSGSPVLFPLRIDNSILETDSAWANDIKTKHIGDFTNWKDHDSYTESFERLVRDLKGKEENKEAVAD